MSAGARHGRLLSVMILSLAALAGCAVEDGDGDGDGNDTGGGAADNGALDSAEDLTGADTGGGDARLADAGDDLAASDLGGGDGAPSDVIGTQACVVFETSQLLCDDAPDGAASTIIFSCQAGDGCERPSARNENRDEIECVDTYRYRREVYPATCDDAREWFAGDLECLIPTHCSGNPEQAGDWRCVDFDCLCPEGGFCPTPLPPGREDMGSDDTTDPGRDSGGPGGPDAGEPDLTLPTDPDAGDEPDTSGPTPPGG